MSPQSKDSRPVLLAAAMAAWIGGMLFVQWLIMMTPSVLQVQNATRLPLLSLSYWASGQLSKPLSPPGR